jgi:hypothetical protein
LATLVVAAIGTAAVVLIEHTRNAGYWVAGAALVVPLVLTVAGKIYRPVSSRSVDALSATRRHSVCRRRGRRSSGRMALWIKSLR